MWMTLEEEGATMVEEEATTTDIWVFSGSIFITTAMYNPTRVLQVLPSFLHILCERDRLLDEDEDDCLEILFSNPQFSCDSVQTQVLIKG